MARRPTARSSRRGILAALLASSLLFTAQALPGNTEPGEGSAFLNYGKVKSPGKKWTKVHPAKKAKKIATKRTNKQLKKVKKNGGKVKVRLKLFDRYTFWGQASTYSSGLHGGPTACGGPYNHYAMTAAHKTLACGTKVVVENPSNGKTVTVMINDGGPFVPGAGHRPVGGGLVEADRGPAGGDPRPRPGEVTSARSRGEGGSPQARPLLRSATASPVA